MVVAICVPAAGICVIRNDLEMAEKIIKIMSPPLGCGLLGFPILNPSDYNVWGIVERETNQLPHNA